MREQLVIKLGYKTSQLNCNLFHHFQVSPGKSVMPHTARATSLPLWRESSRKEEMLIKCKEQTNAWSVFLSVTKVSFAIANKVCNKVTKTLKTLSGHILVSKTRVGGVMATIKHSRQQKRKTILQTKVTAVTFTLSFSNTHKHSFLSGKGKQAKKCKEKVTGFCKRVSYSVVQLFLCMASTPGGYYFDGNLKTKQEPENWL